MPPDIRDTELMGSSDAVGNPIHRNSKHPTAMIGTILLIILILLLLGALPTWGHSKSWGYGPSGGLGLVLIIIIILILLGKI